MADKKERGRQLKNKRNVAELEIKTQGQILQRG